MSWQYTPYVLPPLIASALMVALWAYASQRRYTVGATAFRALMLLISVWTLAAAAQIGSVSVADQLFWVKIGYIGVVGVPIGTLVFVAQYFSWERRPTRREWPLLAVIPALTLLFLWTNASHGLMIRSVAADTSGAFAGIQITYGPWLWVHLGYSYLMLLATTVLVVRALLSVQKVYRGQVVAFLLALVFPWAANLFFVSGGRAVVGFDLTPLAFSLSALFMAWGLQRFGLLDLAPLAREVVVERMADALIVVDGQGRVLDMNGAALALLGQARPQVLGSTLCSLIDLSPELRHACAAMQPAQGEIAIQAGAQLRRYEVRLTPLVDNRQRAAGSIVVIGDITVRREAEIQLRENLALLTTLIANLRMGILAEGPDGRVVHVNRQAAERLNLGAPPDALLGHHMAEFLDDLREIVADPEQLARVLLDPVARGQSVLGAEVRLLDGAVCEFDCVPTQGGGSAVGRLWMCRDVTERIQFEARLRHTHKMEAIGQLAGGIAHEFNNLLTVINGYSQYMQTQLDPGDALYSDAETIVHAGLRAAELTGQMLAFSRRQSLDIRVIDLNEVLSDVGRMLRRVIGEQVDVVLDLAPDLGAVEADSGYIEQVVMNLATNARDAMPTGGMLSIVTRNLEIKEPLSTGMAVIPAGRHVVLEVRDTGSGMDEGVRRHLFEPFFTTKAPGKGTGLGLAMIHGIVEQIGGQIAVESAVGVGTAITIYLPRSAAQRPLADDHYSQLPPPRGHETILLVEDQDDVRAALRDMLVRLGYQVIAEASGRDALDRLLADAHAADLVLTDVVMPGMSGRDLGVAVGNLCPHLPVLYMSGHPDDVLGDYGALSFGDRLLAKPLSMNDLAWRLRRVLGTASHGAESS